MNWHDHIDGYCERLNPGFWAEPINAITNAAFLIAAYVMWRRVRGQGLPMARALVLMLAAIGVGSFLFHTFATPWAGVLDVVPILIFVLLFLFIANVHFWDLTLWPALGVTALFFPYAALTLPLFKHLSWLGDSVGYAPIPVLIVAYAVALARRAPQTAGNLGIGAALLAVSLTFRTLDEPLCGHLPIGTHFAWHCLNALMLGWMIELYRRHMLAGRAARG